MSGNIILIDFNKYNENLKFYGGESGAKMGIRFRDENWLIKYPKSTRGLTNPKVSYSTSPLSEYIGSQIYNAFGIPTHDTLLGFRNDKVVVACRDFLTPGDNLVEFRNIKNMYNEELYDSGTTGSGTILSEVLTVIDTNKVLQSTTGVKERFWDMFVIDAFIGNHDRNNTNWGIIINGDSVKGIAPVYDNGGAFFDKRDKETFETRLANEKDIYVDAINNLSSAYLVDDGHHINPFSYIAEKWNEDCNAAVMRFLTRYDRDSVNAVIADIPNNDQGYQIISSPQSQFYRCVLNERYDFILNVGKSIDKASEYSKPAPSKRR
jgi:hypothetical protein